MIDFNLIDFAVLKEYLIKKGWTEEPFGRKEVKKFNAPTKGTWKGEALIPAKRELIDYGKIIKLTIQSIEIHERRTTEEVIRDIMEMQNGKISQKGYALNMPVIQLYSPQSYHDEAAIVMNEGGRKALIEALQLNKPDITLQAFVNDGEGFDLRIFVLPEPEIRKMQDPYEHDWKDTTLIDPREFDASKPDHATA